MSFVRKFKKVEDKFIEAIREFGSIERPTVEEDMTQHWDVKLGIKFDVKAVKKINRWDDKPDENFHWVELYNVNGAWGWLYGEADYFAFETDDYWVIVGKTNLQDFIGDKCKDKVKTIEKELYKIYTRPGRKDMVVLVKTIDLIAISELMIKKIS